MSPRLAVALVLSLALGVLLATALDAQAGVAPGTTYSECAFVRTTWHPEHAPPSIPGKFVGITSVPEGWTPVNGSLGSYPAMLVCR